MAKRHLPAKPSPAASCSYTVVLAGHRQTAGDGDPPAAIQNGAVINGIITDPVTHLLYVLANKFEALEDERSLLSGTALLDFTSNPGERIDSVLTRFDMARFEARAVGAYIPNIHMWSTILLRAVGVSGQQLLTLLQPLGDAAPKIS